jgi:type VI secretion system protein ImpC
MARITKSDVGLRISSEPIRKSKVRPAEAPLHILYLGQLLPHGIPLRGSPGAELPVRVDKNSFSSVMHTLCPSLSVEVPDRLSGNLTSLDIDLKFSDLKAFRPEGIVAQVPALQRMLQTRTLIRQVREGRLALVDFSIKAQEAGVDKDLADRFAASLRRISSPVKPDSTPTGDLRGNPTDTGRLGGLLGMVDLEGTAEPAAEQKTPMDALITAVTADGTTREDVNAEIAETLIGELDHTMSEQVKPILHNVALQQLESSWRAVKLLVERINFRKNIVLTLLPCTRDTASEALEAWVVQPSLLKVHPLLTEAPVSIIVLDFEFGSSVSEIEMLANVARQAAELGAVLLAGAKPEFLGKSSADGLSSLPPIWQLLQQPEYARWNSLRQTGELTCLGLVLPRFLLRYPYGEDDPVKEFSFTEPGELKADRDRGLWGGGALLVAVGLATLFAEAGWRLQFSGLHAVPKIEGLPLWNHGPGEGFHPLEILIPADKQAELTEAGFIVLSSRSNDDGAYVASAPTLWQK